MTTQPAWQKLSLAVPQADVESCEDALLAAGALSVSLEEIDDEPIFEPAPGQTPLWQRVRVSGLFPGDLSPADLMTVLHRTLRPALLGEFDHEYLADIDWVHQTQADFPPARYGKNLWVLPPWVDPSGYEGRHLMLDPGLAFGTGQHDTTALCLEWLDSLDLQGKTVLDVGCGSGILAIAALKLGAAMASGTDIDPQALKASRDNAALNAIPVEQFWLGLPEDLPSAQRFDVLIANILAQPLITLAPALAPHLAPGGQFALSGILRDQADAVAAQWHAQGLQVDQIITQGDWARIDGHRAD
ncbi:50S ribosomal protein L11 methyltransferase [Halothiobacillus sp. DCM-1]|uniref:50S ribosomal protein L11 methyltransferase n=1 Tax=Halothiobacillus sp. DCM-1 TaxID=3112558 RepID=UPI0032491583